MSGVMLDMGHAGKKKMLFSQGDYRVRKTDA